MTDLIAVLCIVSWRIFWMAMLNRSALNGSPEFVLKSNFLICSPKIGSQSAHHEKHCRAISSRSPASAAISPAPTIRRHGIDHVARIIATHRCRNGSETLTEKMRVIVSRATEQGRLVKRAAA
ncbi:hypothetical protein ACRQ5Q_11755 [Bradyrhizobium sp. PMVTL-01]|uniref:hypothetical protein n=1 Tax=Bradyrhizobium sp. PMVTL-01 TaxID=3434999 RepID=UPI003F6E9B09